MKKYVLHFLCALVLILSYMLVFTTGSQAARASFGSVSVFATDAGRFGFLDQGSGKIYIYDSNLTKCIFIGQLTNLGDPIEVLKKK